MELRIGQLEYFRDIWEINLEYLRTNDLDLYEQRLIGRKRWPRGPDEEPNPEVRPWSEEQMGRFMNASMEELQEMIIGLCNREQRHAARQADLRETARPTVISPEGALDQLLSDPRLPMDLRIRASEVRYGNHRRRSLELRYNEAIARAQPAYDAYKAELESAIEAATDSLTCNQLKERKRWLGPRPRRDW